MKPRKIIREPDTFGRLGCKRTKFREDYRLNDPNNPYVPNTKIPRLRPLSLGPRNVGFLEHELDALIDALAKLRDTAPLDASRRSSKQRDVSCANVATDGVTSTPGELRD
jgi:hypothetical protein